MSAAVATKAPVATAPDVLKVALPIPFDWQMTYLNSLAMRRMLRCGRRAGKTLAVAMDAVKNFGRGHRILYAAPTTDQVETFWYEVKYALRSLIQARIIKVNETEHWLEVPSSKQRIRAKTAWNADTLRGDYADDLYLEEFQLMAEDAWTDVGAPMLLDNNGRATFIYTPPSLFSSGISRAKDPRHAAKMFKAAREDKSGRWETFHFTTLDNPTITKESLAGIAKDMSREAYRREILAEDDEEEISRLVYSAFQERTQIIERFALPIEWPVIVGHDFGQSNPAGLFFAQNPGPLMVNGILPGDFVAWGEFLPGAGHSTAEHVEMFQKKTEGMNVVRRVGGNPNTEDEIRQGYTAHGWHILAPRLKKPKAQIDRTIGLMELNKIWVFRSLPHLREELMNCVWEVDNEGHRLDKIENESRFHLLAALRYGLSDFVPGTVAASTVHIVNWERERQRLSPTGEKDAARARVVRW